MKKIIFLMIMMILVVQLSSFALAEEVVDGFTVFNLEPEKILN